MRTQTDTKETLLVAELRQCGLDVSSVYDLVNTSQSHSNAYPVLVRHLELRHDSRIREGIIRALTVRDAGEEVESALLSEFKTETDPTLKWVLANALRTVMPYRKRKQFPEIAEVFALRSEPEQYDGNRRFDRFLPSP